MMEIFPHQNFPESKASALASAKNFTISARGKKDVIRIDIGKRYEKDTLFKDYMKQDYHQCSFFTCIRAYCVCHHNDISCSETK